MIKRFLTSGSLIWALLFQGYDASAHFHNSIDFLAFGGLSGARTVDATAHVDHASKKPVPPANHEEDCPICQVLALGSVSVVAPSIDLSVPVRSVEQVDFVRGDIKLDSRITHSYLARGPPSLTWNV
jgi:hypothetical protein